MSFLRRMALDSFRDRVRSSDIWEKLRVELLLLPVEGTHLKCFRHLVRMSPGSLLGDVFWPNSSGRRPRGRPRTHWRDYISWLAWEHLGVPPRSLLKWLGRGAPGSPCSGCCPSDQDKQQKTSQMRLKQKSLCKYPPIILINSR